MWGKDCFYSLVWRRAHTWSKADTQNLRIHNINDLTKLIEELQARFKDKHNLKIVIHRLFDNFGFNPIRSSAEDISQLNRCAVRLEEQLYASNMLEVSGALPSLQLNRCMADTNRSIVITPAGALGKCEHYMSELLIGDVKKGITDNDPVIQFREKEPLQRCSSCVLYPDCIRLKHCFFRVVDQCPKTDISVKLQSVKYSIRKYYETYLENQKIGVEQIPDNRPEEREFSQIEND